MEEGVFGAPKRPCSGDDCNLQSAKFAGRLAE